jgi:hypothetical protein
MVPSQSLRIGHPEKGKERVMQTRFVVPSALLVVLSVWISIANAVTDSDVANAKAAAASAQGVADAAKSRLAVITNSLRAVFESSPQYVEMQKTLKSASDDYDAKQTAALDTLHASQPYQDAAAARDHARDQLAQARQNGDEPSDIMVYATDAMKAGQVITEMEAKVLHDDPDIQAAKKALTDAKAASDALENQYKLSLAASPAWQKAKADYDTANGELTASLGEAAATAEAKREQDNAAAAERAREQAQQEQAEAQARQQR